MFGAAIYFIWQERNVRVYQQKERSVDCLSNLIVDTIRLKIRGLTIKLSNEVVKAYKIWNVPLDRSVLYRDMDMSYDYHDFNEET